jgi:prephenate dehydrogenase
MLFDQITIIGVGLIGGSIGLAARTRGVVGRVIGFDRDLDRIMLAEKMGAISSGTPDLEESILGSQLIVLCVPVDQIGELIVKLAPRCSAGTLFTDCGSTKANIIATLADSLPNGCEYVPAHPLAGSEKSGVQNALANLFLSKKTIITPTSLNSKEAMERVSAFWQALGSTVVRMSPDDHDRVFALTSHLPHAIAAAMAAATPIEFLSFTAGGFRDVTRIAAGDPEMWTAIFRANRDNLLVALSAFQARLAEFCKNLEAGDGAGLANWLTEAKRVRDALGS